MPRTPRSGRERPGRTRPSTDSTSPALRFGPVHAEQVAGFVDLLAGAYPIWLADRANALAGFQEMLQGGYPELLGAFDAEQRLVGAYAFYDYVATLGGRGFPAGGLGMVATALDRKKEHIALSIVRDFVRRTRRRGLTLSLLYPFRHDFYAAMGWGAVGEAKQYYLPASALPLYPERRTVRWVRETDWKVFDRIRRQAIGRQGGLGLSRHPLRWRWLFRQAQHCFLAGPRQTPEGYLLARFGKRGADSDGMRYDLEVIEMEWTSPAAMRALLGLLSSQRDQVMEVILDWPRDGNLEAILREPVRRGAPSLCGHMGHGPIVGQGIMLRLEDPAEAFRLRPCRGPDAAALSVSTKDPLRGGRAVGFHTILRGNDSEGARARPVKLATDLATLSRLWAGALRAREAVDFGLAEVSPGPAVDLLDRLLAVPLPWVTERF